MRTPLWRVGALLLGSGFCALVYQIAWLREFRLIFGVSTAASAAVLAIFIGGLRLGGMPLRPRAARAPPPRGFFANPPPTPAPSAAPAPPPPALLRQAYIAAGGTERMGIGAGTIARLVLSAVVLAVPTIAMGGTLPAAARGVTGDADARRRHVAVLYALNTLGAVIGSALATFWWLEAFGTRRTIWFAAAINALIAIAARRVRAEPGQPEKARPPPPSPPTPPLPLLPLPP